MRPTNVEQAYLEYINRARANPPAAATRLRNTSDPGILASYQSFNVDLNLMVQQISAIAPAPPLAFNAHLQAAAVGHSQDMWTHQYQDHMGYYGSTRQERPAAQGYPSSISAYGENVGAHAVSVEQGHAGFEVDFGGGAGGMQSPAGHRNNIHNPAFREIGIGVIEGSNGTVGPQVVTQDFFTRYYNDTPFITGVVYYDLNSNLFYEAGEGIGGVTITVSGQNGLIYSATGVSAGSGGYAVPVQGDGTYQVQFSGAGLAAWTQSVTVQDSNNIKLDYRPSYSLPQITGPASPIVGQNNVYQISQVAGASAYQWSLSQCISSNFTDGAESAMGPVVFEVSPNYAVRASDLKSSGSWSYHLTQPQPVAQYMYLVPSFKITASSSIVFASMLGASTTGQTAKLGRHNSFFNLTTKVG